MPPGCGPGTVNDAFFRFVIDMGAPGPDRGQGGKYLIVPADYDGEIPDGYFVGRSPSSVNVLDPAGPARRRQAGWPDQDVQGGAEDLPAVRRPTLRRRWNSSAAPASRSTPSTPTTANFYAEIAEVIEREPVDFLDPELRGQAAAIGIRKDQPFAPDERMTGDPERRRRRGQRHRPGCGLPDPRIPRPTSTRTAAVDRPASSAATTAG